jgi:hypothetical protein
VNVVKKHLYQQPASFVAKEFARNARSLVVLASYEQICISFIHIRRFAKNYPGAYTKVIGTKKVKWSSYSANDCRR